MLLLTLPQRVPVFIPVMREALEGMQSTNVTTGGGN
jgi:hypothetical protein